MKTFVSTARSVILVLFASAAANAWALSPWTCVGSAGTVDEADITKVSLSGGLAQILPTAPASTSVTLRYNVTATSDLDNGGVNKVLDIRFRDNGPTARVVATLKQYDITTGATNTILTMDSNTMPASAGFQIATAQDGCVGSRFDFVDNAYFVEVVLSRTATTGTPAIAVMMVSDLDIC